MNGLRISRTVLLSIALLIGFVVALTPVAHSIVVWGENASLTEVEEMYSVWGVDVVKDGPQNVGHESFEANWFEPRLDETGGITFLRATVPAFVIGLMLTVAALLLTVLPRTGETRAGGIVSALGFVSLILATFMHAAGLALRNDQVFINAWVPEVLIAGWFWALALVCLLIAALLGMILTREVVPDDARTRYFQCNDCGTVEAVVGQAQPLCRGCGNETRVSL